MEEFLKRILAWALMLVLMQLLLRYVILEAIALLTHVLNLVLWGKPGPLDGASVVLILIRRHRNRKACLEARSRYTPPPEPKKVVAVVTEKKIKAKHYHGEKRPCLQYHAAFRLPDGRELWLSLGEEAYSRLSQGDRGTLTFQGTRCLGFDRA